MSASVPEGTTGGGSGPPSVYTGASIREDKKEEMQNSSTWCGRLWRYPLVQVPLALGSVASVVGGAIGLASASGIMAYVAIGSGGIGGACGCLGCYCVGKLKTKKDLERLVQEDLRDRVGEFDTELKELNVQVRHVYDAKDQLAAQLAEEKELTRKQAEELGRLEKLEVNIRKTTDTIRQMVGAFQDETKELREGVEDLDGELDETREHGEKLEGEVDDLDRENAENLAQIERMEKFMGNLDGVVNVLVANLTEAQKRKCDLGRIIADIDIQGDAIADAPEILAAIDLQHRENREQIQSTVEQVEALLSQYGNIDALSGQIAALREQLGIAIVQSEKDLTAGEDDDDDDDPELTASVTRDY